MVDVQRHSVHTLVFRSLKRTHDTFLMNQGLLPPIDPELERKKKSIKARDTYGDIVNKVKNQPVKAKNPNENLDPPPPGDESFVGAQSTSLVPVNTPAATPSSAVATSSASNTVAMPVKKAPLMLKPQWHPPWKLYRVISGHLGGKLKVSLTGHISSVRGLAFSHRHPYLFSCGEDRQVKCWDLEYNKVIRHYHGHLSAVYSLALHPTIDVLTTAGRDATARIWDMRTKANVHTLTGHTNTVASVISQAAEPQVITGSHDCTIRLWDLAAEGKFIQNLSGHNSIVNCLAINPEGVLVSGADNGTMYMWDFRTG
ncbi:hypothetical protein G9C98_005174 [Cotesia typhae]|uniref:Pleiotropic regulator 1 n=1 Tax=Cotesia typhae TaxID=2053667 RepID=A0A8J5UYY2_9HYME|nr:hypothetical protein G9C98_005174 [Cotesia typhae]